MFKKDFEEERRDRERMHEEMEELKNRQTAEIDGSLEAEMQETKKECEKLKGQLVASSEEVQLLQRRLEMELFSKNEANRECQQLEYELNYANNELRQKELEIQQLKETLWKEKHTPRNNYTLQVYNIYVYYM